MPKNGTTVCRGMDVIFVCDCGFQCTSASEKLASLKRRLHAKKCDKVKFNEPETVHLKAAGGMNVFNINRSLYMATPQTD